MSSRTPKTAVSLLMVIIKRRDELLIKINAKKKYFVEGGKPEEHVMLRAESYNEGLEDAMRIVREEL
jgi:hypothetical protein